ncbi:holo-[acyl-carrier-protein] synthase [SAR202 cluster bacterium AD-802-E10_MRT_200m]|nr:holo-[acyl-carrier-protein] synthase [SAR202 cluster bacterium AD-802-E10_MRT_200m]
MLHVGVDVIEIERIASAVDRWENRFLDRIYTPNELAFSRRRIPQLAGRFAAKEAVMKALGTGARGVSWRDIEVTRKRGFPPEIQLHGRALARSRILNLERIAISISHSRHYAIAMAVGESNENC